MLSHGLTYLNRPVESSFLSRTYRNCKLIHFSFKEIQEATNNFSGAHRIKGSVFSAVLRGERVAIKQMREQVSKEINALHRFHHANLVTLLGICVEESSDQDLYLVSLSTRKMDLSATGFMAHGHVLGIRF